MTLHLVCDISGSMSDDGKPFIMRTLVTTVSQWAWYGYGRAKISLWAWASEAHCIPDWGKKSEYPAELLCCEGIANSAALIQCLGNKLEGKVLLLTDGSWSLDDRKNLERWKSCLPLDTLRIIKVGADAEPQLKWTGVFSSEEIFAALDSWLEESTT